MRVILVEYPGYGPREGALGETSLVADAAEVMGMAHRQYGAPLLVIGESLGAGVAAAASARQRDKTSGLLLITPWDTLAHIAELLGFEHAERLSHLFRRQTDMTPGEYRKSTGT